MQRDIEEKKTLTVQAEGNVDGSDACAVRLQVLNTSTLQLSGSGGITHIYPANRLLSIYKVHRHRLIGVRDRQSGRRATQRCASDAVEIGDQQNRQTIHWL